MLWIMFKLFQGQKVEKRITYENFKIRLFLIRRYLNDKDNS